MWGLGLGEVYSLELILHVALLGLLVFWEVHVHILYGEQLLDEVVTVPDALEPRYFGGKPCSLVEVSDCACQALELVNIVGSLP